MFVSKEPFVLFSETIRAPDAGVSGKHTTKLVRPVPVIEIAPPKLAAELNKRACRPLIAPFTNCGVPVPVAVFPKPDLSAHVVTVVAVRVERPTSVLLVVGVGRLKLA